MERKGDMERKEDMERKRDMEGKVKLEKRKEPNTKRETKGNIFSSLTQEGIGQSRTSIYNYDNLLINSCNSCSGK